MTLAFGVGLRRGVGYDSPEFRDSWWAVCGASVWCWVWACGTSGSFVASRSRSLGFSQLCHAHYRRGCFTCSTLYEAKGRIPRIHGNCDQQGQACGLRWRSGPPGLLPPQVCPWGLRLYVVRGPGDFPVPPGFSFLPAVRFDGCEDSRPVPSGRVSKEGELARDLAVPVHVTCVTKYS